MSETNNKKGRFRRLGILILIAVVAIGIFVSRAHSRNEVIHLRYDEAIEYIKDGRISRVEVPEGGNTATVTMKDGSKGKVIIGETFSNFLQKEIDDENGVEVEIVAEETSLLDTFSLIISLLLSLFPFFLLIYFAKRMNKSFSNVEGSFGKTLEEMMGGNYQVKPAQSDVRFTDVAGIDEEMEQLKEIVDFLKHPEKYTLMGARIPKGVLMNGEPGTGKTLMAKAIAGEAGVPFFQENGSNFEEKFVGVGADRVRQLFKTARESAPCIIFIDEFDSIAQSRYSGHSYSEQTLNELLSEMDGFESGDNVVVIAATNHIEVLDSAITRRGRFDRHIYVPMPDVTAREKILEVHARNKKFTEDVVFADIARKTVGFSGADLESVLNEATIHAVREGKEYVSLSDIDEAIAIVLVGLEKKSKVVNPKDKELTAVHEAGHAIVSAVVRPETRNFGISIVPRGGAGGYNFFDVSDTTYRRKQDMLKELQVCYGGRIAEEIILQDISSGARGDLESASRMALQMVTSFAMDGSLMVKVGGEVEYNKALDSNASIQAEEICQAAYKAAKIVVDSYRGQILKLSALLSEKEYLTQEEVAQFMKENL